MDTDMNFHPFSLPHLITMFYWGLSEIRDVPPEKWEPANKGAIAAVSSFCYT